MCGVIPTQMLCVLYWVCGLCQAPWLTARTHTDGSINRHIALELRLKMFIVCSASECQATPLDPGNLKRHEDESDIVPASKKPSASQGRQRDTHKYKSRQKRWLGLEGKSKQNAGRAQMKQFASAARIREESGRGNDIWDDSLRINSMSAGQITRG